MAVASIPTIIWPNRLRELREAKSNALGRKIFLEEVAVACGCSIGNLSRIEKGYVKPGEILLGSLGVYYDVPADSLKIETPVDNRLGETSIIGAFIRKCRIEMRDSLGSLARKVEKASGQSVSDSQMRLIEMGRRTFQADDTITMAIVSLLKLDSLDSLRVAAHGAFTAGDLTEILDKLHGEHDSLAREIPLFADGQAGELRIPTPAHLLGRVKRHEREYAVRLDQPALGPAIPSGSYLICRAGLRPLTAGLAIIWNDRIPLAVRIFHDQVKGLTGLRDRPRHQMTLSSEMRVDRIVAIVMAD